MNQAPFEIDVPLLSRGTTNRDEEMRDPQRLDAGWPSARVLAVGPTGRFAVDGECPAWRPAPPDRPDGATLLGVLGGVDHWAVSDADVDGPTLRELGAVLDATEAGLVVTAVALQAWHARGGFCAVCGLRSIPDAPGWSRACPNGHQEFPRTDPAVIVLVHDGADRMVLARQSSWPTGRYSVLAGFVEAGESLEAAVAREMAEEIGVQVEDICYLGSQPWPFPRSLMLGFSARADPALPLVPQDGEIASALWVDRDRVRRILQDTEPWRAGRIDDDEPGRDDIRLPGSLSIARLMVEGWAAAGRHR